MCVTYLSHVDAPLLLPSPDAADTQQHARTALLEYKRTLAARISCAIYWLHRGRRLLCPILEAVAVFVQERLKGEDLMVEQARCVAGSGAVARPHVASCHGGVPTCCCCRCTASAAQWPLPCHPSPSIARLQPQGRGEGHEHERGAGRSVDRAEGERLGFAADGEGGATAQPTEGKVPQRCPALRPACLFFAPFFVPSSTPPPVCLRAPDQPPVQLAPLLLLPCRSTLTAPAVRILPWSSSLGL